MRIHVSYLNHKNMISIIFAVDYQLSYQNNMVDCVSETTRPPFH